MEQADQGLHCLSFQNHISHSIEWIRKILLYLTVDTLRHSILISHNLYDMEKKLSHDVASGSDIMSSNKFNKPPVVYRFSIIGNDCIKHAKILTFSCDF